MPQLTGLPSSLPFHDPFGGVVTLEDYQQLVDGIRASRPPLLCFDQPSLLLPHWREYQKRLRADLSTDYKEVGLRGGWLVWMVRPQAERGEPKPLTTW